MFKFLALLFFLCISVAGQQLLQISTLHHQHSTIGVSVNHENLNEVSTSVLTAENWLRTHVLSIYPSTNITSIVVSNRLLCDDNEEQIARVVVLAMHNIHLSLVRWGLESKIRVSVKFPPKCLHQSHVKRVIEFLEEINSSYSMESMADIRFLMLKSSRKLLSESDYSVPSDSLPPLIGVTPPFAPAMQPSAAQPPYGLHLPPCNPYPNPQHGGAMAAPPVAVERQWCVAKPSVPAQKLQEGMDYACGEGGADCGPIGPNGSCYYPDSIFAHASYAFNSYWQKNKNNGGTCGFGGTAMLINSDPSFLECHFTLA